MSKSMLIVFVVIALATGVYAVFLIVNDGIALTTGAIIVVASFALVLWCLSLQKKAQLKSLTAFLMLVAVLFISSTTLAYAGIEPFASGKDNLFSTNNNPADLGAQSESLVDSVKQFIPKPRPSGTYICQYAGTQFSATFNSNTLELNNEFEGKKIFTYQISEDEPTITLTNVVDKSVSTHYFQYIKEYQVVVIDKDEYYKD
ncbi:hypothetical protein ACFLW1_02595 [Chloroflexota bacterium]